MTQQPEGSLEHVEDEAFVIVKAAPRASNTYGETVCIAAIDRNGCWVRLYPVSFRQLEDALEAGRSLALLQSEVIDFWPERRTSDEMAQASAGLPELAQSTRPLRYP